jgi:hypothetical protein
MTTSSSGLSSFLSNGITPPQPTGSDTSTNFPVWYQDYLYNIANAATNLSQTPYTTYPGQQVASPSADTTASWTAAENNVGTWKPDVTSAQTTSQSGASPLSTEMVNNYAGNYNTGVTSGGAGITGALNQSVLGAAPNFSNQTGAQTTQQAANYTGALNNAVQGNVAGYENPYNNQVVGGIESALNTNLTQNVLPQIQDRFVQSGQTASPQQMQAENNAVYQNQQAVGQAIAPALEQGYNTALGAAQTEGNLGFQTGAQTANTGLSAGMSTANTGYGTAGTGVQLGTSTGLQNQTNQLTSASQLGQLGALTSQLNASDTGQLAAAGQAQDTNSQANINAAMNNFYNQQQYPYQNLSYLSNILRGQQMPTTSQTASTTYAPSSAYTNSPLSSFIGTTLGGSALLNGTSLKKGGPVRDAPKKKTLDLVIIEPMVGPTVRGALSRAA